MQSELDNIDRYYKALYGSNFLSKLDLSKTFKYIDILRKRHIVDEVFGQESRTDLSVQYSSALNDISSYLRAIKPEQESKRIHLETKSRPASMQNGIQVDENMKFRSRSQARQRIKFDEFNERKQSNKYIVRNLSQYLENKIPGEGNIKNGILNRTENIMCESKVKTRYQYIKRLQKLKSVNVLDVNNNTGA